ncbi:MAG: hydrolase [Phycisphaera sp.]|nr:hydrolase [Phycisphaera sp.]
MHPCPACGFLVFAQLPGSYDLCPICNWEDDDVQLRFPMMRGGANGESLFEWQQRIVKQLPLSLTKHEAYIRDQGWRLLRLDECQDPSGMPQTGREYFDAIDAQPVHYYWREELT